MKTYSETAQTLRINGRNERIELGGLVRERKTGRIGHTTMVNRETVYVRFAEGEKAKYIYRTAVDSVDYLVAQAECIEDDENAAAYKARKA